MDKTSDDGRNLIIHTFSNGRAVLRLTDPASSNEPISLGAYSTYEAAFAAREMLLAERKAG
jgi:hypothetical protein